MIQCGCKIKSTPHVEGVPRDSERYIEFCDLHRGTGDAPAPAEVVAPPPVEVHHAEPKKKVKPEKVVKAPAPTFPVVIYEGDAFTVMEYMHEVEVRQLCLNDYWKPSRFRKSEMDILAKAWIAAHQELKGGEG